MGEELDEELKEMLATWAKGDDDFCVCEEYGGTDLATFESKVDAAGHTVNNVDYIFNLIKQLKQKELEAVNKLHNSVVTDEAKRKLIVDKLQKQSLQETETKRLKTLGPCKKEQCTVCTEDTSFSFETVMTNYEPWSEEPKG